MARSVAEWRSLEPHVARKRRSLISAAPSVDRSTVDEASTEADRGDDPDLPASEAPSAGGPPTDPSEAPTEVPADPPPVVPRPSEIPTLVEGVPEEASEEGDDPTERLPDPDPSWLAVDEPGRLETPSQEGAPPEIPDPPLPEAAQPEPVREPEPAPPVREAPVAAAATSAPTPPPAERTDPPMDVTPAPGARGESWFVGTGSPAPDRDPEEMAVAPRQELPTWVPSAVVVGLGGVFVLLLILWLALS